MRIKITQPGWETYTGFLSGVDFENGVSMTPVAPRAALQLGAFIRVVELNDDGDELGQLSPALEMMKMAKVSAPTLGEPLQRASQVEAAEPADEDDEGGAAEPAHLYTQAELETIASEKGIAGLREIGTPLGARDTSIQGLIRAILIKQTAVKV